MSEIKEQEYNKRFDTHLWKKVFKYIKPYKKKIIMLCIMMILVGIVEATFPILARYSIDNFVTKKTVNGMFPFSMIYFSLIIISVFCIRNFVYLAGTIDIALCTELRKKGFEKLQELSLSYYNKTPIGWIMSRIASDINKLGDTLIWGIVDMMWGLTMMVAISIYMLILNWKLALIVLSVIPVLAIISIYFQQKILTTNRKVRKINSQITGAFNEGISGAKTTKVMHTGERHFSEFKVMTEDMYKSSFISALYTSIYVPIVISLGSIGTALAIWFGGNNVQLKIISYGTLVAFISYTIQFFEPVRQFARVLAELIAAQASAERIISLLETQPDIIDSEDIQAEVLNNVNWPSIKGDISFKNVSFSYEDSQEVLADFNLDIKAGETIALVGETGSGKSTIVNLACRFFEPTEGEILIDGVDYRKRSIKWLQSSLGYVLQSPQLFSGTIRENIRYGKLDATNEQAEEAARIVDAHKFIIELENGYDTEAGEEGSRLSTGQKQLISLARAILANPRIFILDEATSSVDTETEFIIQQAIQKLLKGRTSFIIAHRLSTIRSADRILVIQNGKLIEEGSHKQLLKLKGYYYRLYTNQFAEELENQLLCT